MCAALYILYVSSNFTYTLAFSNQPIVTTRSARSARSFYMSSHILIQLCVRLVVYMAHAHLILSNVTVMMDGKEINVSKV